MFWLKIIAICFDLGTAAARYDISATIASDHEYAGTAGDVSVQIIGSAGSTEEVWCPSGTFNRDPGKTVTCSVTSDVDIGNYTCVTWRLSGDDGLNIAQFTTFIDNVAQTTIIPADGWLDELDGSISAYGSNGQTANWCITAAGTLSFLLEILGSKLILNLRNFAKKLRY